ncbi:GNAT family N-acetyltransferase [Microbacterium maritypicum]|uniref:GNAT family N-acetyltransferase n=1 Tax=Microbacterium maritypicum TaxID=33918 RepID=UPI0037FD029B
MSRRRALLHCNAGAGYGMGHLMRTLALAAVARDRGWSVSLIGDIDEVGSAAAQRIDPDLAIETIRRPVLLHRLVAAAQDVHVLHLDTYEETPDVSSSGALVSSMQDGPYGVRVADLSIDANLGAEETFARPDLARHPLVGLDVAVVREQVLRQRVAPYRGAVPPRVLVVMGGSDPQGLTARVVRALDGVPEPLSVTVVDPRDRVEVREAAAASVHDVQVLGFIDDLPALARTHDLAVTAAGTSVWDFACMGVPMAVLCAVDNQSQGYTNVVRRGLAMGLGVPPHEDLDARVVALGARLRDGGALGTQSAALQEMVDGLGTWRIVTSWEQLVDAPPDGSRPSPPIRVRAATRDDAGALFDWRNDASTRAHSRSSEVLEWSSHVSWLDRTLADPDRRLLVVESEGQLVASTRWDRRSGTDWEASITMAPEQRGRGLAGAVLAASEQALTVEAPCRLLATVHTENKASTKLFQRAGYLPHLPADAVGFATFAKWRLSTDR